MRTLKVIRCSWERFNIGTEKGLKNAERYQQALYKEYSEVDITISGLNKILITGRKPI